LHDSSKADWSLLPGNAEAFFELETGFDRKQLKRAYNAKIRIFKPEKFPEKFQKIRAAFEQLDNQIRYGHSTATRSASKFEAYQWDTSKNSETETALTKLAANKPTELTLQQRLETQNPVEVFKWLRSVESKTAYDYFALAALSDVVKNDPTLYFQWLLTGLKAHPNDPGLIELVREFLLRSHSDKVLISLLATTSKVVSNDRFYYLTEKAWLKLLNRIEFPKFRTLLARCESNLNIHRNYAQLVFYCELLKSSVLVADESWVAEKFHLLQSAENGQSSLDHELQILDALRAYREQYETQRGCPVCDRIYKAIGGYFMLDERQGDAAVIDCQTHFAENAQSLLDAFARPTEGMTPMLLLWIYINHDVIDRHEFDLGADVSTNKKRSNLGVKIRKFLSDLDSSESFDGVYLFKWFLYRVGALVAFCILPFIVMPIFSSLVEIPYLMVVNLVLSIAMLVVFSVWVYPRFIEPAFNKMVRNSVMKDYHRWWRGRFVQLFDATHATMEQMVPMMYNVLSGNDRFTGGITWTAQFVNDDVGLLLYSMAVTYRR